MKLSCKDGQHELHNGYRMKAEIQHSKVIVHIVQRTRHGYDFRVFSTIEKANAYIESYVKPIMEKQQLTYKQAIMHCGLSGQSYEVDRE